MRPDTCQTPVAEVIETVLASPRRPHPYHPAVLVTGRSHIPTQLLSPPGPRACLTVTYILSSWYLLERLEATAEDGTRTRQVYCCSRRISGQGGPPAEGGEWVRGPEAAAPAPGWAAQAQPQVEPNSSNKISFRQQAGSGWGAAVRGPPAWDVRSRGERRTIDLRFLHLKILILKRHSFQTKCPTIFYY